MPILNASDIKLDQITGSVPNVSGAMMDWFQKMTFVEVKKEMVNFQVCEIPYQVEFQGVWQPFSAQQLAMKPESQQAWSWFMVHTQTNLELKLDDVFLYQAQQYRIMQKLNYMIYGYYEYHIVEDYKGSGPL